MQGEGFLKNCLQGQAMYKGPGNVWIWPWERSWHFPSRRSAIASPDLLACGHWAWPPRTRGPEILRAHEVWAAWGLWTLNLQNRRSFLIAISTWEGSLVPPSSPEPIILPCWVARRHLKTPRGRLFASAHYVQLTSHRVTAITNQPLNRRSLTVCCKSLRLVKICAKLIPKEQSNLKST